MGRALPVADWNALSSAIAGDVVLPGSDGYEAARKPAMARFWDIAPLAVVRCRTPEDVAEALALARRSGIDVTARSGGHCFAGRSSTRGLLARRRSDECGDRRGRHGDGGRRRQCSAALYDALAEQGRTIAGGCGPTVGIAGLTLGGGLGILGRRHGLTADQLLAAEIVLADGQAVRCDEHHTATSSGRCAAPEAAASAW